MMSWLKRPGRCWVILTDEDRCIAPASILTILIVHLPGESHLGWTLAATRARFPRAVITVLLPDDAAVEPPADPWLECVRLPQHRYLRRLASHLRRVRRDQWSAVVLLSLHPLTTALALLWFRCNRLLFNHWGQWFLLRRRMLVEWLALRPGADRGGDTWSWTSRRARRAGAIVAALSLPAHAVKQCCRWLGLVWYISVTLTWIGWRRWRVRRRGRVGRTIVTSA